MGHIDSIVPDTVRHEIYIVWPTDLTKNYIQLSPDTEKTLVNYILKQFTLVEGNQFRAGIPLSVQVRSFQERKGFRPKIIKIEADISTASLHKHQRTPSTVILFLTYGNLRFPGKFQSLQLASGEPGQQFLQSVTGDCLPKQFFGTAPASRGVLLPADHIKIRHCIYCIWQVCQRFHGKAGRRHRFFQQLLCHGHCTLGIRHAAVQAV